MAIPRKKKLHIARRYLLPKQITANGLTSDELSIPDETVTAIIRGYTREAGVRNLERELGSVCRKVARQIAEGQIGPIAVTPDGLRDLLGRPRFFEETAERLDRPGVVTGLVWTPVGGDIIFIEAAMMPSRENHAHTHRPTRRRDERVGDGRADLCALECGVARY